MAWLWIGVALAQPPEVGVRLPAEVTALPGRLVVLTAESQGEVVRFATWHDGVDLLPLADRKSAVFCSPVAGRFTVLAWSAVGNRPTDAARVTVVVAPAPVPGADDAFVKRLKSLLAAGTPEHVALLAGAYRKAAAGLTAEVRTAGQLAGLMRGHVQAALPGGQLAEVRAAIAEEFARQLPLSAETALTPKHRETATKLLTRIADTLEGK